MFRGDRSKDLPHTCKSKSKLCYDRRPVGQSVLASSPHLGPKTRFLLLSDSYGFVVSSALSDERTSLSFTIAAGPRQRGHSQVRVPRYSRPYFTVSDSRLPQPGGPGPRMYIPQEKGGPVITPGIGFPFRCLLRLAGLRWRYSTPPQRGGIHASLKYIIFKNSVRTSQETHHVSATKPNRLLLFRETVAVYCEKHTEHTDTLSGQNEEF
jgi:hypothetical protein